MAQQFKSWRAYDDSLHPTKRGAVEADLAHMMDIVSNGEVEITPLQAGYMAANPRQFIDILNQLVEKVD